MALIDGWSDYKREPQIMKEEVKGVAENLRISTDSQGFATIILDDHEITDVAAYTLQEGYFDSKQGEYTRKLTLEILLGPMREVTVQL